MKIRYVIVFVLIIAYAATVAVMLTVVAPDKVKTKQTQTATNIGAVTPTTEATSVPIETGSPSPTPTPWPTPSPTPTTVYASNCLHDKNEIQIALDAYYDDNGYWPTADGQPGDIVWDELVPDYMSEMPLIDGTCDWQVSGNPEGSVCVAHTC